MYESPTSSRAHKHYKPSKGGVYERAGHRGHQSEMYHEIDYARDRKSRAVSKQRGHYEYYDEEQPSEYDSNIRSPSPSLFRERPRPAAKYVYQAKGSKRSTAIGYINNRGVQSKQPPMEEPISASRDCRSPSPLFTPSVQRMKQWDKQADRIPSEQLCKRWLDQRRFYDGDGETRPLDKRTAHTSSSDEVGYIAVAASNSRRSRAPRKLIRTQSHEDICEEVDNCRGNAKPQRVLKINKRTIRNFGSPLQCPAIANAQPSTRTVEEEKEVEGGGEATRDLGSSSSIADWYSDHEFTGIDSPLGENGINDTHESTDEGSDVKAEKSAENNIVKPKYSKKKYTFRKQTSDNERSIEHCDKCSSNESKSCERIHDQYEDTTSTKDSADESNVNNSTSYVC